MDPLSAMKFCVKVLHDMRSSELAPKRKKARREQLISENVAGALDRANISNAEAVHILAATVDSGKKLEIVLLPTSTVKRKLYRSQARPESLSDGPIVLNFDGKLLPALTGLTK